jgi:hypothetical protein
VIFAVIILLFVAAFMFLSACNNLCEGDLKWAFIHGFVCFVCVLVSIIIFFHN